MVTVGRLKRGGKKIDNAQTEFEWASLEDTMDC